jgi:hypothetical protein
MQTGRRWRRPTPLTEIFFPGAARTGWRSSPHSWFDTQKKTARTAAPDGEAETEAADIPTDYYCLLQIKEILSPSGPVTANFN